MYHYYYIFIITVTHYYIYDGNVRESLILGTVDVGNCYGGLEQGLLEQGAVLLQLLVGDGHNPLLDNGGLGLYVCGSR